MAATPRAHPCLPHAPCLKHSILNNCLHRKPARHEHSAAARPTTLHTSTTCTRTNSYSVNKYTGMYPPTHTHPPAPLVDLTLTKPLPGMLPDLPSPRGSDPCGPPSLTRGCGCGCDWVCNCGWVCGCGCDMGCDCGCDGGLPSSPSGSSVKGAAPPPPCSLPGRAKSRLMTYMQGGVNSIFLVCVCV